jgi:hypothetical protein
VPRLGGLQASDFVVLGSRMRAFGPHETRSNLNSKPGGTKDVLHVASVA